LRFVFFTVIKLSIITSLLAQDFSVKQKILIASKIDELLKNYQKYGGLSKDQIEISALYVNKLNNLFKGTKDVYVYNDIDPQKLLNDKITYTEYVLKIKTWYKAGLATKLIWDASLISEAVRLPDSKKSYAVSLLLEKQVMGVYKSNTIVNNINDLYFIIEFEKSGKTFTNFKIAGIQKERPILEVPEEPEVVVREKKEKYEKYLSVYFNPLYTSIYNKDISNNDYWTASPKTAYNSGLGMTFYTAKLPLGLYTGLSLTNYRTDLKLEDYVNESNTTQLRDKDDDVYYRYIEADVEESNSLSYLDLSLGISYNKFLKKETFGIYVNAGGQFSYLFTAKYKISGTSTHRGYYPQYHVILFDLEDYDLTSENLDSEDTWDLNSINISGYLSIGFLVKLHRLVCLNAGPYLIYGISDLNYNTAKHRDDYISTVGTPGKTNTQALGLNISLLFIL